MALVGDTNPAHGVIATRPQMAPQQNPVLVIFPFFIKSIIIHVKLAAAAAKFVATIAALALPLACKALPPLNPFHPNHSRSVPSTTLTGE